MRERRLRALSSVKACTINRGSRLVFQQRNHIFTHIQQAGGDWSVGEIARMLSMPQSTVSKRVDELLADQQVVAYPRRKDRFCGMKICPIGLPKVREILEGCFFGEN